MRALALALLLVACTHGAPPASRNPLVRIECPIPTASIWVDERFVAEVRAMRGGMRVTPGKHRLEVRAEGYHTRYYELTLAPGETRTISVDLPEAFP